MSRTPHGADAFENYYGDLYAGRWQELRSALLGDPVHTTLETCLLQPYYLDPASLAVAERLDVQPGQDVLDLCAAPGGKTLVLACRLGGDGRLVANERSATRRARLHRVLESHLPGEFRGPITVTGHDAARWGLYEPESYDRVLADVPCSSERHVLTSPTDLGKWSPSRTKRLAQGAYAIACAAADSLRSGGLMVYSTCALSPLENDRVVERILNRSRGKLEAVTRPPADSRLVWETTNLGAIVLPDASMGAGPMYFAMLRK